ncbi:MAG: hypothetical protein WBZ40_13995 [Acidimicrobiia bacterium]
MTTDVIVKRPRVPLTRLDKTLLGLHIVGAIVVGIFGFLGANDPEFADLQRIVIAMLIGLWGVGIVVMALIVRLVSSQLGRVAILLGGPFIFILIFFGRSMLGWG